MRRMPREASVASRTRGRGWVRFAMAVVQSPKPASACGVFERELIEPDPFNPYREKPRLPWGCPD